MQKIILVVEDTKDTRHFMKFLLEMNGYFVIEAVDGMEAIEIVKNQTPDLILMDISMPEMDGLTATRVIRQSQDKNKMPIIAVTACDKSFYEQAIDAGCNDLICKPVDFDALESFLNQYFPN
jgi:CheY-like chemotaxis protein